MDIQSRLLTVDFYNCKAEKCSDAAALSARISEALRELNLSPLQIITDVQQSGHISLMALLPDGHLALHVHPELCHPPAARRLPFPLRDPTQNDNARRPHSKDQEYRCKGHPHPCTA